MVLPSGRPAKTFVKTLGHLTDIKGSSLALLAIRIGTGRRHQIRIHSAHTGHAVVSDAKYSAENSYRHDTQWCPRNFLHRFRLSFRSPEFTQVAESLPTDLQAVLRALDLVQSDIDIASWAVRPKAWDCCPDLRKRFDAAGSSLQRAAMTRGCRILSFFVFRGRDETNFDHDSVIWLVRDEHLELLEVHKPDGRTVMQVFSKIIGPDGSVREDGCHYVNACCAKYRQISEAQACCPFAFLWQC